MKLVTSVLSVVFALLLFRIPALAQANASLAENAALRYWSAFSALQDSAITDQEAKELNSVLENMGPYDYSKYKDLLQKNALALKVIGPRHFAFVL